MLLTDAVIALDAVDLSGNSNTATVEFTRTDHDRTTFGARGKIHRAGMAGMSAEVAGFHSEATETASVLESDGLRQLVIAPDGAAGSPAFVCAARVLSSSVGGAVDNLAPWSSSFVSGAGVDRGIVAYYGTTTDDASPGHQLGSLSSSESLVATIHNFGDEAVTVEVQSSPTNGWSMPEEHDDLTVAPGQVGTLTVVGPDTDTWWRVAVTADEPTACLILFHRTT